LIDDNRASTFDESQPFYDLYKLFPTEAIAEDRIATCLDIERNLEAGWLIEVSPEEIASIKGEVIEEEVEEVIEEEIEEALAEEEPQEEPGEEILEETLEEPVVGEEEAEWEEEIEEGDTLAEEEVEEEEEKVEPEVEEEAEPEPTFAPLTMISGIGPKTAEQLESIGIRSVEELAATNARDLSEAGFDAEAAAEYVMKAKEYLA